MVVTGAALFASCQPGGQSCSPEVCGPGQVRVLIDQCAPLLATGEACDVGDPMDVCPPTDACLASHCVTVPGFGIGDACIAGQGCKYNTTLGRARFCKSNAACGDVANLPPFYCAAGSGYGHDCDSSFEAPACSPCEPGLACVSGQCRKKCAEVADCPCDSAVGAAGFACEAGTCCRPLQQPCDSAAECCSGLDCSGGQCCGAAGASCSAVSDCCGTNVECKQGVCTPCQPEGASCDPDVGDCCSGAPVCGDPDGQGARCLQTCEIGQPPVGQTCKTGLPGQCASGTYDCVPVGNQLGLYCRPPEPSKEVCDGKDNDCDGKVDEAEDLPGAPCSEPNVPGCQNVKLGFKVPGVFVCDGGTWKCDVTGRFCGTGQGGVGCNGTTLDNEYCGQCGGQPCSFPSQNCTPNQYCDGLPGDVTGKDPLTDQYPQGVCPCVGCQDLDCWLPADVGSCGEPQ